MSRFFAWIRQWFCKHELEFEDKRVVTECEDGIKRYVFCKKCGYHSKHWKHL